MSKGEEKIVGLLKKGHIKFEREKHFNDLRAGRLRYDFYVYTQKGPVLIEFNGEQHYHYIQKFHKSQKDFNGARERDRRKISYALANQIPIYIIPYWELDGINCAADLFQERFRAKTRWKNDTDFYNYKNLTKR